MTRERMGAGRELAGSWQGVGIVLVLTLAFALVFECLGVSWSLRSWVVGK
jgi:hypothetical protein